MGNRKTPRVHPWGILVTAFFLIITLPLLIGCSDEPMRFTLEDISEPINISDPQDILPGTWEGTFTMQGTEYTVRFSLQENEDGSFIGAFSLPQQTQALFIFDEIEIDEDGVITFQASSIQAGYTATLRAVQDSQQITLSGTWKHAGSQAELTMQPRQFDTLTRIERPQDPARPYPYHEKEVVFPNVREDFELAGTLTYPEGAGPFPVVILISGSGSHDRNEEIFGHRPFLVLADHLTRNGIAVLRYDDRGVGGSGGESETADSYDLSIDAESALDYLLEHHRDIISDEIGLVGHSEGGIIAPMVADRRNEISFLILLAGPGQQGDQVLLSQTRAILEAQSLPESLVETTLTTNRAIYSLLMEEDNEDKLQTKITQIMRSVGIPEDQIRQQLPSILLPWFRFFLSYDPGEVLTRLSVPVLALGGSLDLQVLAEENIPRIEAHLEAGESPQVTTKIYEGLNHLFQPAQTGMVDEYGTIPITIAPQVLEDISQWIWAIL